MLLAVYRFVFGSLHESILQSDLDTLVFKYGEFTNPNGRRPPTPQLVLLDGGSLNALPNMVTCTNLGAEAPVWECSAFLPNWYKFGETNVICEGFANDEDPNVLVGSCRLELTLVLTVAHQFAVLLAVMLSLPFLLLLILQLSHVLKPNKPVEFRTEKEEIDMYGCSAHPSGEVHYDETDKVDLARTLSTIAECTPPPPFKSFKNVHLLCFTIFQLCTRLFKLGF